MTDKIIWIRNRDGRLEREIFGSTPFADVPESPFYVASPGSHLSSRAWMDDDGYHIVLAHDCAETREVHVLRWPTWQAVNDTVNPSYACDGCGFHAFPPITWTAVSDPTVERNSWDGGGNDAYSRDATGGERWSD